MSRNNEIVDSTTVGGINVEDMNDAAIFNRIAGMKADLKELTGMGIQGAAMSAAKADLEAKISRLVAIVNARHETDGED